MSGPPAGRRALITGAGSGIGAACAELLAEQGAAVAVLDIRPEVAEDVAAGLRADGAHAIGIDCDIGDDDAVAAAVRAAADAFGGLDTGVAAPGTPAPHPTH